jgi:hypothetical protein
MRKSSKLLLTALTAALVLSIGAGSAFASRGVSVGTTTTRATSRALTFNSPEFEAPIVCRVQMTISLHRTIAKSAGTLAGFVTAVTVNECRNGSATILAGTLPWHTTYVSFAGTLPNITSIRLQLNGAAFLIVDGSGLARCLYRGNAQGTTGGGTTVNELRADPTINIPLSVRLAGSFFCPANGNFEGTFAVEPTVRLTLI